jgi:hypothetical protein
MGTNEFTIGARQRQAQNVDGILGEFTRSEAAAGDFLRWLDAKRRKDGTVDIEGLERRLRMEEGPSSSPATPTSGLPPTARAPKHKVTPSISETALNDGLSSRERKYLNADGEMASRFPQSLPRRLTTLLSNVSPATVQTSRSTYRSGGTESNGDIEDLHDILAMTPSSSAAHISFIPPVPGHKSGSLASQDDSTYATLF